MRIDVKKCIFVGPAKDKSAFFEEAMKTGTIHFISEKRLSRTELSAETNAILKAIKILNAFPAVPQVEIEDRKSTDKIVKEILSLDSALDKSREHLRLTILEIDKLSPFGRYSKTDLDALEKEGHLKVQFFCSKQGEVSEDSDEHLIHVSRENGQDYFISIAQQSMHYEKAVEIKFSEDLPALNRSRDASIKRIHEDEAALKSYAQYREALHRAMSIAFDDAALQSADACARHYAEETLFAVEGWVPKDRVTDLQNIAASLDVYIDEIAIEDTDSVPTCLENRGFGSIGEDLVNIYDTPATSDSDPSLWVLFFFALFFSMIIGDGGYGLIILLAGAYFKKRQPQASPEKRRFFNLTLILGTFCIAWGFFAASFFGMTFSPDSSLRKVSLLSRMIEKKAEYHFSNGDEIAEYWIKAFPSVAEIRNPQDLLMNAVSVDPKSGLTSYAMQDAFSNDLLLELALFIGVIHLSLSFLKNCRRNPGGVGWILFMAGAYLYFPKFLGATSLIHFVFGIDRTSGAEIGVALMYGGMGFATGIALIRNKIFGVLECMNLLQIFGDVMSYLRLYALGLSGALVIGTTYELAAGLNPIWAGLLIVGAHSLNLVLCVMGGVIHGLRLNFLEWYHYCFDGGGKQFKPLKRAWVKLG